LLFFLLFLSVFFIVWTFGVSADWASPAAWRYLEQPPFLFLFLLLFLVHAPELGLIQPDLFICALALMLTRLYSSTGYTISSGAGRSTYVEVPRPYFPAATIG
jgi:hypothetical protein